MSKCSGEESPRPPRSQNGEETLFKIGKDYKGDFGCIQTVLSHLGRTCAVVPFASISPTRFSPFKLLIDLHVFNLGAALEIMVLTRISSKLRHRKSQSHW